MGDVKPWLWGKNPCFVTLLIFHLPLLTSLMLQLVVGGVIAEVVVVVAGCQPYPLAHCTHVCPFFSLMHSSLVSSLSPRFWSVGSSRISSGRFWSHIGIFFLSTSCCSPSRRELLLLLTHSQFRVLSAVVVHPRAQEELFIPHGV